MRVDTPQNYSGPAVLVLPLGGGEIDVELDLAVEGEPTPNGGSMRSWQADFTTLAPFRLLTGECKVLLPDGRQGDASIRQWQSLPGEGVQGLLIGIGPSPT